jgi:hypothetical protein
MSEASMLLTVMDSLANAGAVAAMIAVALTASNLNRFCCKFAKFERDR